MRFLISLTMVLCYTCLSAQSLKRISIYNERFSKSQSTWPVFEKSKKLSSGEIANESAVIMDGKLVISQEFKKGNTSSFLLLPPEFSSLSKALPDNCEIKFDYGVLEQPDTVVQLGLVWDLHDVNVSCEEGKFYKLNLVAQLNDDSVSAELTQRSECNGSDELVIKRHTKVKLEKKNSIVIQKSGFFFTIMINKQPVLEFNFKGTFNVSRFSYGSGSQYLDNFKVDDITFDQLTGVRQAQAPDIDKPALYIVMAGLENYTHPDNQQDTLKVCLEDVDTMYNFWNSVRGGNVPKENIKLYKDSEATISQLLSGTRDLAGRIRQKDYLIFYLTGHGNPGGFIAYDGLLEYERLNTLLKNIKCNKLFIVDACKSGSWQTPSLAENGKKIPSEELLALFYKKLEDMSTNSNWLLSCKPTENSYEGQDTGHSIFTLFLLEALMGKADSSKDQFVDLSEAYVYLTKKFDTWNKKMVSNPIEKYDPATMTIKKTPREQHPVRRGSNGDIPLSIVIDGEK